jgi:hypothetical protein
VSVKAEQLTYNLIQLITLIGNDFNSNSELQITIRKKNDVVPCPKKGDVTHALSEAHWQHSAIESFLFYVNCSALTGVYDWQYKYLFVCLYANHLP